MAKVICAFFFAYAKSKFSHDGAHMLWLLLEKAKRLIEAILLRVEKKSFNYDQMPTLYVTLMYLLVVSSKGQKREEVDGKSGIKFP